MTTLERFLALFLGFLSLLAIYLLQPILMPFMLGIVLAYLGDPLVDRLENWGLNRAAGSSVVFFVFALVFIGSLLVLLPLLAGEVVRLVRLIPTAVAWLQTNLGPLVTEVVGLDPFEIDTEQLGRTLAENWQETGGVIGAVLAEVTRSGMALVTVFMNVALTPVVAFYLMRDWDFVMGRLRELLPRENEATVVGLVSECDEVLSAFLRGQLMVMVALGILYSVGLMIVGLDLALLIGMLAGLASIVPYLGVVVGIGAALIAAFFQFDTLMPLVYVSIVFGIGQLVESFLLTPLLVGDRIGLHPVAVIFAVLAGGQLFGFVGVLLALPVAAVLMVILRHLHARYLESEYYQEGTE